MNPDYTHIQKAFEMALRQVMKPYKGRPLTLKTRAEIKRQAIAVTKEMIPTKIDINELSKFIDGILDQGLHRL
jgi:hypothetical protein